MSEDVSSALRPSETFVLPVLISPSATAQGAEATSWGDARATLRPRDTLWSRYTRHKGGVAGLIVLLFLIVVACLAPVLAPADPFSLTGAETVRAVLPWSASCGRGRGAYKRQEKDSPGR